MIGFLLLTTHEHTAHTHTHIQMLTHTRTQTTLELKNVTGASRQLRIVPLSSPYFSIKPGSQPCGTLVVSLCIVH